MNGLHRDASSKDVGIEALLPVREMTGASIAAIRQSIEIMSGRLRTSHQRPGVGVDAYFFRAC
jgi:hypothetical protein